MRRLLGSRLEVAFSAGLLLWAIAEALLIDSGWPTSVRVAFAVAATAPLALRHRHPFAVAAWTIAAMCLDGLVTFLPFTAVTPLQGPMVAVFAIAAYGQPRRLAGFTLATLLAAMPALFSATEREVPVTIHDATVFVVMQLLALSAGWVVRLRREEVERATALATSSDAERRQRLREDLAAERRRIARELHAIVTRDLAAIARLSRTARARIDGAEEQAQAALAQISDTTTAALDELRRLLQVLRADGRPGAAPPGAAAPALAVAAARARGWQVELVERGERRERIAGRAPAELAAGRIVEELLDGDAAAAGDARPVTVALTRSQDGVALTLRGDGRAPAALRDPARLAAARERARLHSGTLRRRRTLRGWRVEVVLPAGAGAGARASDGVRASDDARAGGDGRAGRAGAAALAGRRWARGGAALRGLRPADAIAAALALTALAIEQLEHDGRVVGWASGLALIVLPLLLLCSRAGFATACLLAVGLLARAQLGWMPPGGLTLVAVLVFAPYAAAVHAGDARRAIAGGVVTAVCSLAATALWFDDGGGPTDLPLAACVLAISWLAGWYVRGSSLQARGLRLDQLRRAESAPARLRAALDAERRSVARDLHDVVAHGVSLIGLLAAGARATLPRDPLRARQALADLDDAVAGTHVELARLMAALRAGDEPATAVASPGDLGALVADARRAGQQVTLAVRGGDGLARSGGCPPPRSADGASAALAQVPAGVLASACRVVQEALTNTRKHAPGATAAVRLTVEPAALLVEVRNGAPATPCPRGSGARRGIDGMRERARLLGGELDAGPCAGGGFRVQARLPWGDELATQLAPALPALVA